MEVLIEEINKLHSEGKLSIADTGEETIFMVRGLEPLGVEVYWDHVYRPTVENPKIFIYYDDTDILKDEDIIFRMIEIVDELYRAFSLDG